MSWGTWVRLIVWLIIGLAIYVFYGQKRSIVGKEVVDKELNDIGSDKQVLDDESINL
ncbi:hypothetical protein SAMD00019534_084310 [Acytostelium subglobosum LB1]|uniref:hypothetical protein n=1 Tax=Acytostelium subglobosum LB1 TaxID=1410327 RepID=UPI0006450628|nr:hypothetical protein SAMD00019534_084310 [Acytostelium subglobosum LB1]GAM25256.1 hypothetical protein SAMD00019534_084310 [Acytostelium subglobosum LB1]|eukprot:XP_012751776.1 hypothetical protein SAMD00019534_084310 [Acytostelium subglobosum LB1]